MSVSDDSLPLTKDAVYGVAKLFGGLPHGDDADGVIDISFPTLHDGAAFAAMWRAEGARVTLREPVAEFDVPVVVQVMLPRARR